MFIVNIILFDSAFFLVFVVSCCVACAIAVYFAIVAFRVEAFSWTLTGFIAQFSLLQFLLMGLVLSHVIIDIIVT